MDARPLSADGDQALSRLRWWLVAALALMCAAGLRHNLFWGGLDAAPWLPNVLNALEGGCLVVFAAVGTWVWWRSMALLQDREVDLGRLLRLSLPILIAAIVVPCFLTTDPVDYIVRGRIMSLHGGNPYRDVALDFPSDPFVDFGDRGWKSMSLPYGPLVANLQAAVAWLANLLPVSPRVELVAGLLLFKTVFAAALLGCAVLSWRIAAVVAPGNQAWAFVAVLWNPLLLNDCIANAHNDSLVLFWILVAVSAGITSRFAMMVFALCLGAMTKVIPVVLGPLWLVAQVRRGKLIQAVGGLFACAVVGLLFHLQFFAEAGYATTIQRQGDLSGASLWWLLYEGTGISMKTLSTVGRVVVIGWVGYCCLRLWRSADPRELVFGTASSLLLLGVLGAALWGSWYHVWWLPFGLLLRHGYFYRAAVCSSVSSCVAYLGWAALRRFDEPAQVWIVVAGVIVPLLLALRFPRAAPVSSPSPPQNPALEP